MILGSQKLKSQDVLGVLEFFGKRMRAARKEYHLFTAAGIEKGVGEDLRGGGLIRSSGGVREAIAKARMEKRGKE